MCLLLRSKMILASSVSVLTIVGAAGCNGLTKDQPVNIGATPQTYMAPVVAGLNPPPNGTMKVGSATVYPSATAQLANYLIDDNPDCSVSNGVSCFSQSTTTFSGMQQGTSVNNAGTLSMLARGLRSLQTSYAAPYDAVSSGVGINYTPPLPGSYALELSGQAGGLMQLLGQPATPIVATTACPSISPAQIFQFITLPARVVSSSTQGMQLTWNPAQETAFGSVSINTQGVSVSFSNVQQFTLPVNGGAPGTPVLAPPPPPLMGICTSTPYGDTISVPGSLVLTNPGNGQGVSPPATLGIGPSGLLVESNGNPPVTGAAYTGGVEYNNLLGAGTGAVGLPQPSQALANSPVNGSTTGTGPQYLGFLYGTGHYAPSGGSTAPSSNVVSFGFSASSQASCAAFATQTGALANGVYGGDFPINPTTQVPDATPANASNPNYPYGNCNLAIDLGAESATSHGLYPTATVWIGKSYVANSSVGPITYSFPAVAIAGQLGGKYAIFIIGNDPTSSPSQAWSLYLLQSN